MRNQETKGSELHNDVWSSGYRHGSDVTKQEVKGQANDYSKHTALRDPGADNETRGPIRTGGLCHQETRTKHTES